MKLFYYFIFLLISFKCISQINSGEISYKVTINPISVFQKDEMPMSVQKASNKINSIIPTLEFSLKFNNNNSVFSLKNQMSVDKNEFHTKMAIILTQGDKIIFSDISKSLLFEYESFLGENFVIKSSFDTFKWRLTKEKKQIGKYLCYKAVAIKEVKIQNNEIKKFNYTAWYCPEIQFKYGPANFIGLPGMVLEISTDKLIYVASQIKLSKELIKIEIPNKAKIVTREEFNEIEKKTFENNKF